MPRFSITMVSQNVHVYLWVFFTSVFFPDLRLNGMEVYHLFYLQTEGHK